MTATTAPITEVAIGGSAVALGDVEWQVSVTHGRSDIASAPQAATALLTLRLDPDQVIPDGIGKTLTVQAYSGVPRFTGDITNIAVGHEVTADGMPAVARVAITAAGYLNRLTKFTAGTAGFTEDTFANRATALLEDTGLTYVVSNDDGTHLLAEDAGDTRTVLDILGNLCQQVGATMADLPDGTILVETYTRRATNYTGLTWAAAIGTWADQTASFKTGRETLELPADAVVWAPIWTQRVDTIINTITVSYGDPVATVTDTDAASIAEYGVRGVSLETTIRDEADAEARAAAVLTAQAQPRYSMTNVTVRVDSLNTADRTALLNLESGDRVLTSHLPQTAPDSQYLGVVEGWSESYTPLGHLVTLYLSDPRHSYAMATWGDISVSLEWGEVAAVAWYDVILASDLT